MAFTIGCPVFTAKVKQQTFNWMSNLVIKHNLCPFAYKPYKNQTVKVSVSWASSPSDLLRDMSAEIDLLASSPPPSPLLSPRPSVPAHPTTTLIVFPHPSSPVSSFPAMVSTSYSVMSLLDDRSLTPPNPLALTLVTFHPEALHSLYESSQSDDARSYSLRSPYPTFHLIREVDLLDVAGKVGLDAPDLIAARNAEKLRRWGSGKCKDEWKKGIEGTCDKTRTV